MHNEYIKSCCIKNKKDKLLLLKYANIDISKISKLLEELTLELMRQCYNHTVQFHELNKKKNKRYHKIEPLIQEQLKEMLFIEKKFIEYFNKSGKKTKEDLFTYILAFQMVPIYYNEYLYNVLVRSIKQDFTKKFWEDNDLDKLELYTLGLPNFYILRDTKEECSTGQVNIDFEKPILIIEKYLVNSTYKIDDKLELIKEIGNILDNYYNAEFNVLNCPYKDSILDIVDNVKVSREIAKPKSHIKRR